MFYFMLLRILSFCLDKVALKSKPTTDYTLLNYIFYIFYPTFVFPSMLISFQILKELTTLQVPTHAKLFTCDAVSIVCRRAFKLTKYLTYIFAGAAPKIMKISLITL